MNRLLQIAFFLYITFLLSACHTYTYVDGVTPMLGRYPSIVVIGYSGDIKEFEDVGIITTDGTITVKGINGKPMIFYRTFQTKTKFPSQAGRYQVHLMPGKYTLDLRLFDELSPRKVMSASDSPKVIEIKKGEVIHLSYFFPRDPKERFNPWAGDFYWDIKLHDGRAGLPAIKEDFEKFKIKELFAGTQ